VEAIDVSWHDDGAFCVAGTVVLRTVVGHQDELMGGRHRSYLALPQRGDSLCVSCLCQERIWVEDIDIRIGDIGFELSWERPTEASNGKTRDELKHSVVQVDGVLVDGRHLVGCKENLGVVVPWNVDQLSAFFELGG